MSGIYIHIPFCKQACHYCDFHFSTSMGKKDAMLTAIKRELVLRKGEFKNDVVATIYFGGGTPSVLTTEEIQGIIATVYTHYDVVDHPEVTLEANPDDLTEDKIIALSKSPINRLSIGIQSFFEEDLKMMNRAHNAEEAKKSLEIATQYFSNISIDLIYGLPGMSNQRWEKNIALALAFGVPHISSYALTVEPKTALANFIKKGVIKPVDDEVASAHFNILLREMEANGLDAYETSNFGKPGFYSENNSAYWLGKKYIGVGPSAHSYDGIRRGWNINNNVKYIKSLAIDELPMEVEVLSKSDRYNEYIMTGLRTIWGVSLTKIHSDFGANFHKYLLQQAEKHIKQDLLVLENDTILTTKKGKFLADGIASDLFMINLSE
ncbi:radical SAM family heme chaperone HemW [Cellulophaga sp. L1A9]|uniref:radical SAM family heme chaperone HemW n=1 Tax=Cellulophaga sp. L1A9 TaxID=2686362 RepID=UPI00131DB1AE|nr:radical SAM family heme chaperone HemW [Cellulophaga sp. L1A9]